MVNGKTAVWMKAQTSEEYMVRKSKEAQTPWLHVLCVNSLADFFRVTLVTVQTANSRVSVQCDNKKVALILVHQN